jgi:hypothetical protein
MVVNLLRPEVVNFIGAYTHSGGTYFSALRRHIATEILSFELKEINGKKKYLTDDEEKTVTAF